MARYLIIRQMTVEVEDTPLEQVQEAISREDDELLTSLQERLTYSQEVVQLEVVRVSTNVKVLSE